VRLPVKLALQGTLGYRDAAPPAAFGPPLFFSVGAAVSN